EIANAAKVLAKLDANLDDILTPEEAAPGLRPAPNPAVDFTGQMPVPQRAAADNRDFLILTPDLPLAEMAQTLATRYGRQRDDVPTGRLRRTALTLDPDVFRRLDRNGDGVLDLAELEAFTDRPADVELRVRLGERAKGTALLDVMRPAEKTPLAGFVRKTD